MKKFCIFCGKKPQEKTKEHVVPQWLIAHTGSSSRKINLGIDFLSHKARSFSFNQFTFPACKECNQKFSTLESECKPIITKILDEQNLSSNDLSKFLTWFDKIRIGLWLGYLYLNKNITGIDPHFYIGDRLDTADRTLLIYKTDSKQKHISFIGVGLPLFEAIPSCFGLSLNQFNFVNISTDCLFSRRLGLPYPKELKYNEKIHGFYCTEMIKGRYRIMKPLIRGLCDTKCVEIYQPIIRQDFLNFKDIKKLYETKYVKKYIDINQNTIGKVLIKNKLNNIALYPDIPNKKWIPKTILKNNEASKIWTEKTFYIQNIFIDTFLNYTNTPRKFKNFLKDCERINKSLLQHLYN